MPLADAAPSLATRLWRVMEFLGCLWATMVAVLVLLSRDLIVYAPQLSRLGERWMVVIRWTLVAMWVLLDVPFLIRLWRSWLQQGTHEIALHVAALQPLRHPILRPLAAVWWLGHFALALLFGLILENGIPMDPRIAFTTFLFFLFCCAYASNIFLIHAVTALTRGPAAQRVWNWRGIYDLGIVVAGLVWRLNSHPILFK